MQTFRRCVMQLKYPLCCHCSWVIDAFHFVYQQDGDKEFYSFFHPSFHPLHPMASNPAHVQGMISPQEGRGGARWSCNRAGGGFSYSIDAAGSWSKMALGGPLNLIEISYQWKKMKHNKWNFKGCPPSGQKPEVLMSYFLSLIYVVECFGENWAKPLQPKKIHLRRDFWNQSD